MCFRQVVYGYVLFLSRLGVKNLVVAVNKMDTAQYAQERFEEIATNVWSSAKFQACSPEVLLTAAAIPGAQVREYIQKYFDIKSVAFVPISGWLSENVDKPCDKMPWYKGWTVERHISGKACTVRRMDGYRCCAEHLLYAAGHLYTFFKEECLLMNICARRAGAESERHDTG
jgi:translation elongation factor EF-1alpha